MASESFVGLPVDANGKQLRMRVPNGLTTLQQVGSVADGTSGVTVAVNADGSTNVVPPADLVTTGTLTAANQSVTLTVGHGESSWTVQASGSFVASLITEATADGVNWVPVNSRASNGGRLSNAFTSPGLYRGVVGGVLAIRVRCTAYTSGSVSITVRAGGHGAVFSNSDIVVQQQAQYYASSAGLNSMYGSTSDVNTFTVAPADLSFFALYNPSTSTVPLYVYRISLGVGNAGILRRRRFVGVPTGGTATPIDNRAGVSNTPQGVAVKSAAGLTLPGTPVLQKALALGSSSQDTSSEDFSLIIPAGQGLAFSYTNSSVNSTATAEIVWSEGSTLT